MVVRTTLINVDSVNVDADNSTLHTGSVTTETPLLTAAEAAARLGVKRQTLYAYVSRGVLTRQLSLDGRTSLYDPLEIESLRSARKRTTSGEVNTVIASGITRVLESGHHYREVPAVDLVRRPFEEVADHLWDESGSWTLEDSVRKLVRQSQDVLPPDATPIDRFRISVTIASSTDRLRHDPSAQSHAQAGRRMLLAMVHGLPLRSDGGSDAMLSSSTLSSSTLSSATLSGATLSSSMLANDLWPRMTAEAGTDTQRACLNAALVLLADHGLAASTFAARVAASVRADPYSVVSAGLGPMAGPLHGGASSLVHRMFEEAGRDGAETVLGRRLAAHEKVPGVGHAVYKTLDRRELVLHDMIVEAWGDDHRLDTYQRLRTLIGERVNAPLNIDLALGAMTWLAGMGPEGGQCMFVARTVGWVAHGSEEFSEPPLRFRPVARWLPRRPKLPEDQV